MQRPTKWIAGTLVVAVGIYACSPGPQHLRSNPNLLELREQFVYITGVSALLLMILSMLISIRSSWLSRQMHGLDKAYIIHKWTGIFSSLFMIMHWLGEKVPQWLVELELIPNPGNLDSGVQFSELEIILFQSGTILIEYFFYAIIILVIIALIKKIPYHIFRKTHKVFPFIFLIAAYHGATAPIKEQWFATPAGYLLLIVIALGVVAAFIGIFQRIGWRNKIKAEITQLDYHHNGIIDVRLKTTDHPFVHKPGQYAFLRFEHDGEPHPFTIASSGSDANTLRFAIKNLGDFTGSLVDQLKTGQAVEIEGPYGEFNFHSSPEHQIWIAGGIGITPFLSQLEHLTQQETQHKPIHFWYCTRGELAEQFPASLKGLCEQAGVTLHHLNSTKKEYLTANTIYQTAGNLTYTSIRFCGPSAFGQCLLNDLEKYGFDKDSFHYDDFDMR